MNFTTLAPPGRYANLLTQKVPLPPKNLSPTEHALAFVQACRDYRTLRAAVEGVRWNAARPGGHGLVREAYPIAPIDGVYDDRGTFHFYPAEAFVGARAWDASTSVAAWRAAWRALVAWGVASAPWVGRGDVGRLAEAQSLRVPSVAFVRIVRALDAEGRRGAQILDAPEWSWLGLSREQVIENLHDADAEGVLLFQHGGGAAQITLIKSNRAPSRRLPRWLLGHPYHAVRYPSQAAARRAGREASVLRTVETRVGELAVVVVRYDTYVLTEEGVWVSLDADPAHYPEAVLPPDRATKANDAGDGPIRVRVEEKDSWQAKFYVARVVRGTPVDVARLRLSRAQEDRYLTLFLKESGCLKAYEDACARLGRTLAIYNVDYVEVLQPDELQKGHGIALYVAAAQWAAKYNGVLLPHACVGAPTSPEAQRVWKSARFRAAVTLFDGVVAWGGAV